MDDLKLDGLLVLGMIGFGVYLWWKKQQQAKAG